MLSQPGIGGRQHPQNKWGLLLYYSIYMRGKKTNKQTTQGE